MGAVARFGKPCLEGAKRHDLFAAHRRNERSAHTILDDLVKGVEDVELLK
jgi:hypothetical protein